jgi:hypothetical protein
MRYFFQNLHSRNAVLYYFGWLCLLAAAVTTVMIFADDTIVLGINAWIKPTKFLLSTVIFAWSMGWYLYYLESPRKTISYTVMAVLVMSFELVIITWQAANGRLSHFNISSPLYLNLYNAMGVAIVILVFWTLYINVVFFTKKNIKIPRPYLWGIRLGLLMFIIFSLEGGIMAAQLRHTIGAEDGGAGIPFVNWSGAYGDLRVAHFFGIHALQILPITGYFIAKNSRQLFVVAGLYFVLVSILFAQAMQGIPVFHL